MDEFALTIEDLVFRHRDRQENAIQDIQLQVPAGELLLVAGASGYELENLQGGLVAQVRKMAPLVVPVTIHAIIGSEDIIDAMDLRAFGVGPRTWLEELHYRRLDYFLIIFGAVLFVTSFSLSLFGFGNFWVPEVLIRLMGG